MSNSERSPKRKFGTKYTPFCPVRPGDLGGVSTRTFPHLPAHFQEGPDDADISTPGNLRTGTISTLPPQTPLRGFCGGVGKVGKVAHPPYPLPQEAGRLREDWKSTREDTTGGKTGGKTRKRKVAPIVIVEDTREQRPLTAWPEFVRVEPGTLHTGDYSFKGWETSVAIERKSLEDFAGTMIGGYEASSERPKKRFNRELERMRHYDLRAVVVTATPEEVLAFRHHCGADAFGALWNFGLSVFATYGVPVFYLGSAENAARWIADLARHYITARTKKNFTKEDRSAEDAAAWIF